LIDIESRIFTAVAKALRTAFPGIQVEGEPTQKAVSFPAVTIVEMDNATVIGSSSSRDGENQATLMYEVNAYSNLPTGKKAQCKSIMAIVDNEMQQLGFIRDSLLPVTNFMDTTIFRMTARFSAVVDHNKVVYRR
jgi:hypothetical protein